MSWQERINADFVIATGDGKQFVFDWMNASKATEYNVAQFEFNELSGSLVKRGLPKGRAFNLELYFQGDDHLDRAEEFDASAADSRAWTISHPIYGTIVAQPLSLTHDNSVYNVTKLLCPVVETIGTDAVAIQISVPDKIAEEKVKADEKLAETFEQTMPAKKVSTIQVLQKNIDAIYQNVSKSIQDTADFAGFLNKYNEVNSLINGSIYDAMSIISQVQALISMPAQFANILQDRVKMFKLQFSLLNAGVSSITTKNQKKIFENNAGTVITAMILCSITNTGTAYRNRTDVVKVIDDIYNTYTSYVTNLDSLQTDDGSDPESYIPDANSMGAITNLVNYAIASLLTVALSGRQERAFFLEEDSNPILLAHRLYGLLPDDSTINEIIDSNNFTRDELIEVKKGRKIVYYI